MYSDLCYNAGCVQNVIFCKSFRNRVSHDNRTRKLFFQTPFPGAFFSVFFSSSSIFLNRRNISFFFSVNIFQSCRCVRFLIKSPRTPCTISTMTSAAARTHTARTIFLLFSVLFSSFILFPHYNTHFILQIKITQDNNTFLD